MVIQAILTTAPRGTAGGIAARASLGVLGKELIFSSQRCNTSWSAKSQQWA